ncbi:MAG: alpha/beta fold hydrolase [Pseudomonadota bacterium]|jgi:pimeloyl-ACP methyl ester carboxylesterase|nr:alpha/beta fold hydrolase [Pseudomonadota bacterium]
MKARPSPWILLRGLTRDSHHWADFPRLLAEQDAGAPPLMLDLPGNGRLNHEPSPTRIEHMAEYCRAETRRRGVEPPYRLVAVSLGGMVATAWAALAPTEIASCALINTSMRPFSPAPHRLRPAAWSAVLRMALAPPADRDCERMILKLTSNRPIDDALLDDWTDWRGHYPVSRSNALRQLLAAARYRAPASPPATRWIVIGSRGDRLVDPRCSRALARAWSCEVLEHPDAGHDLTLDDGAWVARQLTQWSGAA